MLEAFANDAAETATVSLGALDLIFNASFVVQLVLMLLIGFSIVSWGIMFTKWGLLKRCAVNTERFLDVFWSGKTLDLIYTESKKFTSSSVAKVFQTGYVELQRIMERERTRAAAGTGEPQKIVPAESAIHNLERALQKAGRSETLRLERSLSFLATAGSTGPFIGLFGTVWGIMNAFQNIGAQGGASLAVVAPGIAEALIATAIGLACAIPAVMGYNFFTNKIRGLRAQMENFSGDFLNIVKRNYLMS